MKLRHLLATGCLFAFVAAQECPPCQCDPSGVEEPPPEETPPGDETGYPSGNTEECEGPEPPWYCTIGQPPELPPGFEPFQDFQDNQSDFYWTQHLAEYKLSIGDLSRIKIRIALPDTAKAGEDYDVVIQVEAPNDVGWAAIAWGGTMVDCPLTVVWANCSNVMVSSRFTESRVLPKVYDKATYKILPALSFVNDTHFQITTRCSGCTKWEGKSLDPASSPTFAWAYAIMPPDQAANNQTRFSVHDAHNTWTHDLSKAKNANFNAKVDKYKTGNGGLGTIMDEEKEKCVYTNTAAPVLPTVTRTRTSTVTVATATVTVKETVTACPTP